MRKRAGRVAMTGSCGRDGRGGSMLTYYGHSRVVGLGFGGEEGADRGDKVGEGGVDAAHGGGGGRAGRRKWRARVKRKRRVKRRGGGPVEEVSSSWPRDAEWRRVVMFDVDSFLQKSYGGSSELWGSFVFS